MRFYIADTFTDSLKKLSNPEQKQTKTTVFDLQMNPGHPGFKFHRLEKGKDPNFWSVRVNDDLRCILHKKDEDILVCYVDHHDKAYSWAEKRKIEVHPKTRAVQIVVVPELIEPPPKAAEPIRKKILKGVSKETILSLGVPEEWISRLLEADEDSLFEYLQLLPAEAGEALLDLALGKKPTPKMEQKEEINPFEHPDSLRRFKLVTGQADLEEALNASWYKWAVFLHPLQKSIVEKNYNGPVRVSGSAGTGKTIVALHRAVHLAKTNQESIILLATFSSILANNLHQNLGRLISSTPQLAERIEVNNLEKLALRLYKQYFGEVKTFSEEELRNIIWKQIKDTQVLGLPANLVVGEIQQVILAWNLKEWSAYKEFKRLGRRTKLKESHRKEVWELFEKIQNEFQNSDKIPMIEVYFKIAEKLKNESHSVFDAVILDEAQDLTPSQMEFVSCLSKDTSKFFFTGDLGQRIFQIPFSWSNFGIDIRGRSFTLKVNYRTSEQIRIKADRLLAGEISDFDGIAEKRTETISLFQGPKPEVQLYPNTSDEQIANQKWVQDITKEGVLPSEILVIVRSEDEFPRAKSLCENLGLEMSILDIEQKIKNCIKVCTMHSAKGLEYRAVLILACDSEILPKSSRLESASDESELEEVYATERHLLYVACTRARDLLRITGVKPGSEFLGDIVG